MRLVYTAGIIGALFAAALVVTEAVVSPEVWLTVQDVVWTAGFVGAFAAFIVYAIRYS